MDATNPPEWGELKSMLDDDIATASRDTEKLARKKRERAAELEALISKRNAAAKAHEDAAREAEEAGRQIHAAHSATAAEQESVRQLQQQLDKAQRIAIQASEAALKVEEEAHRAKQWEKACEEHQVALMQEVPEVEKEIKRLEMEAVRAKQRVEEIERVALQVRRDAQELRDIKEAAMIEARNERRAVTRAQPQQRRSPDDDFDVQEQPPHKPQTVSPSSQFLHLLRAQEQRIYSARNELVGIDDAQPAQGGGAVARGVGQNGRGVEEATVLMNLLRAQQYRINELKQLVENGGNTGMYPSGQYPPIGNQFQTHQQPQQQFKRMQHQGPTLFQPNAPTRTSPQPRLMSVTQRPSTQVDGSDELPCESTFLKMQPTLKLGLQPGEYELRVLAGHKLFKLISVEKEIVSVCVRVRQIVVQPPKDSDSDVAIEQRINQTFDKVPMTTNLLNDDSFFNFVCPFIVAPPGEYHIFVLEFVDAGLNTIAWTSVPTDNVVGARLVPLRLPPIDPFRALSDGFYQAVKDCFLIIDVCRPNKPRKDYCNVKKAGVGSIKIVDPEEPMLRANAAARFEMVPTAPAQSIPLSDFASNPNEKHLDKVGHTRNMRKTVPKRPIGRLAELASGSPKASLKALNSGRPTPRDKALYDDEQMDVLKKKDLENKQAEDNEQKEYEKDRRMTHAEKIAELRRRWRDEQEQKDLAARHRAEPSSYKDATKDNMKDASKDTMKDAGRPWNSDTSNTNTRRDSGATGGHRESPSYLGAAPLPLGPKAVQALSAGGKNGLLSGEPYKITLNDDAHPAEDDPLNASARRKGSFGSKTKPVPNSPMDPSLTSPLSKSPQSAFLSPQASAAAQPKSPSYVDVSDPSGDTDNEGPESPMGAKKRTSLGSKQKPNSVETSSPHPSLPLSKSQLEDEKRRDSLGDTSRRDSLADEPLTPNSAALESKKRSLGSKLKPNSVEAASSTNPSLLKTQFDPEQQRLREEQQRAAAAKAAADDDPLAGTRRRSEDGMNESPKRKGSIGAKLKPVSVESSASNPSLPMPKTQHDPEHQRPQEMKERAQRNAEEADRALREAIEAQSSRNNNDSLRGRERQNLIEKKERANKLVEEADKALQAAIRDKEQQEKQEAEKRKNAFDAALEAHQRRNSELGQQAQTRRSTDLDALRDADKGTIPQAVDSPSSAHAQPQPQGGIHPDSQRLREQRELARKEAEDANKQLQDALDAQQLRRKTSNESLRPEHARLLQQKERARKSLEDADSALQDALDAQSRQKMDEERRRREERRRQVQEQMDRESQQPPPAPQYAPQPPQQQYAQPPYSAPPPAQYSAPQQPPPAQYSAPQPPPPAPYSEPPQPPQQQYPAPQPAPQRTQPARQPPARYAPPTAPLLSPADDPIDIFEHYQPPANMSPPQPQQAPAAAPPPPEQPQYAPPTLTRRPSQEWHAKTPADDRSQQPRRSSLQIDAPAPTPAPEQQSPPRIASPRTPISRLRRPVESRTAREEALPPQQQQPPQPPEEDPVFALARKMSAQRLLDGKQLPQSREQQEEARRKSEAARKEAQAELIRQEEGRQALLDAENAARQLQKRRTSFDVEAERDRVKQAQAQRRRSSVDGAVKVIAPSYEADDDEATQRGQMARRASDPKTAAAAYRFPSEESHITPAYTPQPMSEATPEPGGDPEAARAAVERKRLARQAQEQAESAFLGMKQKEARRRSEDMRQRQEERRREEAKRQEEARRLAEEQARELEDQRRRNEERAKNDSAAYGLQGSLKQAKLKRQQEQQREEQQRLQDEQDRLEYERQLAEHEKGKDMNGLMAKMLRKRSATTDYSSRGSTTENTSDSEGSNASPNSIRRKSSVSHFADADPHRRQSAANMVAHSMIKQLHKDREQGTIPVG